MQVPVKLGMFKAIYFATVCLPPPLLLGLYPIVYIWRIRFLDAFIAYYPFYFWAGLALLILDLWCSNRTREVKILWTILNTFLGSYLPPDLLVPIRSC